MSGEERKYTEKRQLSIFYGNNYKFNFHRCGMDTSYKKITVFLMNRELGKYGMTLVSMIIALKSMLGPVTFHMIKSCNKLYVFSQFLLNHVIFLILDALYT